MLKWILGILLLVGVIVAAVWSFGKYIMQHANEEGTFSADVYEQMVESKLLLFCNGFVKSIQVPGEDNTSAQYESTCKCFANDMFEKVRSVPPDDLDAYLDLDATNTSARKVFLKCGYAAGLN